MAVCEESSAYGLYEYPVENERRKNDYEYCQHNACMLIPFKIVIIILKRIICGSRCFEQAL